MMYPLNARHCADDWRYWNAFLAHANEVWGSAAKIFTDGGMEGRAAAQS